MPDLLYMRELLKALDFNQTDVARELGVKKTIVNKVFLRKENSARVLVYFNKLSKAHHNTLLKLHKIIINNIN